MALHRWHCFLYRRDLPNPYIPLTPTPPTTADPEAALKFVTTYLSATEKAQPHPGGDGACALVKWALYPGSGYQMHFVNTFEKPQGDWTLTEYGDYMDELHRGVVGLDVFMNNRVKLYFSDLDGVVSRLQEGGEEVRAFPNSDGTFSVMTLVPTGIIIECVGSLSDDSLASLELNDWCYCSLDSVVSSTPRHLTASTAGLDDGVWPLAAVYAVSDGNATAAFFTDVLSAR